MAFAATAPLSLTTQRHVNVMDFRSLSHFFPFFFLPPAPALAGVPPPALAGSTAPPCVSSFSRSLLRPLAFSRLATISSAMPGRSRYGSHLSGSGPLPLALSASYRLGSLPRGALATAGAAAGSALVDASGLEDVPWSLA